MSGSGTQPKFETPQSFDVTIDAPIDARERVSSLASIDTELVVGVRYLGMKVWVEDIKQDYYFPNDVNIPEPYTTGGGTTKYIETVDIVANTPLEINHNLEDTNISVITHFGNDNIIVDYTLGDSGGSNTDTYITITSIIDYTGLKVTVIA